MVAASPVDVRVNPNNTAQRYVLWGNGRIDAIGGAVPITDNPQWYHRIDQPVAVALHITNWTTGAGYVLDMQGGFQPIGGAPALGSGSAPQIVNGIPFTAGYQRRYVDWSWDPAGTGQGYVLDRWGEILPFGGATPPPRTGRRFTWGAARKLQMRWTPTKLGVQMDMYGYLRPEFGQGAIASQGATWLNHDYARDFIVTDWTTFSGYKLNLYGGVHAFGAAPGAWGMPQRVGADVARKLTALSTSNPLTLWIVWSGGQSFDVVSSSPPTAVAGGGSSEVQTVTITGSPTGGSFTLTYSGQTTAAIAYNATATTAQSALRALTSIGSTGVTVTKSGQVFTVAFGGTLADTDVPQMTATSSLTGGTSPAVAVATTTAGITSSPALTVTDSTRPDLMWSYSDLQNDTQAAWQVLVFTQTFVTGHSMTNPLAYASSAVVAREGVDPLARGIACPVDLANGSYRLYVRVKDTANQWSAWDDHGWTQNVPPPTTPTGLTATANQTASTVALSVSATTGGSAALVRFECSDDGGATWSPVRGADALPIAATVTATDRDAPLGVARTYRAVAYNTDPRVLSAPSNTQTVTLTAAAYLLTAIGLPTLGGVVSVQDPSEWSRPVTAGVFQGIGADYPTVVKDGRPKARRTDLHVLTESRAEWDRLKALVESGATLVYRDPFGEVIYCEVAGNWTRAQLPAAPRLNETTPLGHVHAMTLPLIEVAPPHLEV